MLIGKGQGRVIVAMSGGVDSSLSAYLLREAGYEVIGITMLMWEGEDEHQPHKQMNSAALQRISHADDAQRVAQELRIPHFVLNLKDQFEEEIITYFCGEYLNARTPNPCVLCNKTVKFGALLRKARDLDAAFVSTGHYARVEYDPLRKRYLLKRGKDPKKDQSYFLCALSQNQLAHALFPLGSFRKDDVREKAMNLGLTVHEKPESQEICFIPGMDYRPFLKRRVPRGIAAGNIVDTQGRVLGRHKGLPFYTIGQRRGLGLTAGKPLYVVGLDKERNLVVVGEKEEGYSKGLVADRVNWIAIGDLRQPIEVKAKIRHSHKEADAIVEPLGNSTVRVEFMEPQEAITPGQAVVFYDGDTVIGGGRIERMATEREM